eukprot:PhF_6_TR19659/c0_g1_i3/m.28695
MSDIEGEEDSSVVPPQFDTNDTASTTIADTPVTIQGGQHTKWRSNAYSNNTAESFVFSFDEDDVALAEIANNNTTNNNNNTDVIVQKEGDDLQGIKDNKKPKVVQPPQPQQPTLENLKSLWVERRPALAKSFSQKRSNEEHMEEWKRIRRCLKIK